MQHHETSTSIASYVPLLLIAAMLFIYLLGVISLQGHGKSWSYWRTLSFASGIGLLTIAMLPQMMQFAHHDIRGHMVQHLLIGMFAPIGLVFGMPVTLALKTLPKYTSRGITTVLGSNLFHVVGHPVTAFLLNIGGMFVLYLTPVYNTTLTSPSLHFLLHFHFLAAGYLFTWSIAGPDPAPRRPGFTLRVTVIFISIAAHAYLSKLMYARLLPVNSPHSAEQIQSAAQIMYYGGDLSELLLVIALFSAWYQKQSHPRYKANPLFN
ncbi:cytochrome c oxidase assembly protein [Pontibacter korlensis]|uniref:Cytochrome C oxidase assembly protein n=1 Tax=Pontibacter korlensis TaxID=400092 RepID=A0A0E3ZIT3_9BACT|nr:cytochrome c oxidase assembly protein [Pontibacter korlensis]AKD05244.1 hypothetical protein PKOR_21990 [Pontibacter korlensis]